MILFGQLIVFFTVIMYNEQSSTIYRDLHSVLFFKNSLHHTPYLYSDKHLL